TCWRIRASISANSSTASTGTLAGTTSQCGSRRLSASRSRRRASTAFSSNFTGVVCFLATRPSCCAHCNGDRPTELVITCALSSGSGSEDPLGALRSASRQARSNVSTVPSLAGVYTKGNGQKIATAVYDSVPIGIGPRMQAGGRARGGGQGMVRALRVRIAMLFGEAIAREVARVYRDHYSNSFNLPRFGGAFFAVANCCYRRSRRRLVGSLLDECLLDAVTNLGVHRTPRRLCGRLNAAAQLVIKADIEPRWLLPIVRMHGHPIQCRGGTLGYDQITSRVRSGRLRRSATTATSALRYLRYLRRPAARRIVSCESSFCPRFLIRAFTALDSSGSDTLTWSGTPFG